MNICNARSLYLCTSQEKVDKICKKDGDKVVKLIFFIIIILELDRSKIF